MSKVLPQSQDWKKVRPVPKLSDEYRKYVQSDAWKQLKAEKRHSMEIWRCEACGYLHDIECHHIIYRTPLESAQVGDLMALCRRCHQWTHEAKDAGLLRLGTGAEERKRIICQHVHHKLDSWHGDRRRLAAKRQAEDNQLGWMRHLSRPV